jgi:hypothetical protein
VAQAALYLISGFSKPSSMGLTPPTLPASTLSALSVVGGEMAIITWRARMRSRTGAHV